MKKTLILLLICLSFNTFAEEELLDEIVAIVEEDVILRSELDRAVNNVVQQFQARQAQLPPTSIIEKQVLERLINMEIQVQKADLAGVRISEAEVDQALTQIAAQNKLTLQQMQMAIENDGMSFAEFRNDMMKELKSEKIRNGLAEQEVNVSEQEIDLFLADNELNQGEVLLSHILIGLSADANEATLNQAKQKVDLVLSEIESGNDFSSLAIKYSDGQRALDGGDLGWKPTSELPTLFSEQIKLMKAGEHTRPIRSASGFHIIKLEDKREQTKKMITEYNARHIMIENSELVTPQQGMEIINEIYSNLQDGQDFAVLAEEKSDDINSAPLGGDLGWFQLLTFGQRFANVLKALDDNETSAPFQTQVGWHIVQRLGKRESDITEEFKRAQAAQSIKTRKVNEEIESWIREIRGEAFVDIKI